MRATLIHSPDAGYEACTRHDLLDALSQAGYDTVYCTPDDDLEDLLHEPGDVVAIAGGDGTTRRVASHLVHRNVPLGLLPLGTANNVGSALSLRGEPADLIAAWPHARLHAFDAGVASGPWGDETFIEGVGLGLFAETLPLLSHHKKTDEIKFATAADEVEYDLRFLLDRLADFRPRRHHVTVDGRDLSGDYLLFEIMNIGFIGPNLHLAPEASTNDGQLDVVAVTNEDRAALTAHLEALIDGETSSLALDHRRAHRVQIDWNGRPLHVDSRVWADERCTLPKCRRPLTPPRGTVDVRVERAALTFLVNDA